jgi:hypothetical protein
MPLRTRFVRSFAWGLVVTGLVIGLAGEILVIENELVSRELPGADEPVSLWPVVGVGAAIATLGLLFLVLRPLYARLLRRRLLAGLVKITRNGFDEH